MSEQADGMRQLIKELAEDATVLLSTHIMQEVSALCSRVLILRNGDLAVDANLDELQQSNFIQLDTDISEADLKASLGTIDGVVLVETVTEKAINSYKISIDEESNINDISASIAVAITTGKGSLYRLQPIQKDLEMLFREVNANSLNTQEVNHAI